MARANGLIIRLPGSRLPLLNTQAKKHREFSEPVPWFSHDNSVPLLCFIVESNLMTHVSLGRGGQKAGTYLRRVNLFSIVKIHPVPIERFADSILDSENDPLSKKFFKGGLLKHKELDYVIQILMELAPELTSFLLRFSKSFESILNCLSSEELTNLALQKEAVLTALLVAGQDFDRRVLQNWAVTEKPTSFLDGLKEQHQQESQIIRHDFLNFPGFEAISGNIKGTVLFSSNRANLTVIYADKEPLERLTGADLIYYNETYKSFVLVQYKVMEKNGYRPDKQLDDEITRVERLLNQGERSCPKNCTEFRLHSNPFFLKFCPRIDFIPESSSLSRGIYVPLEYWKILDSSGQIAGPRAGRIVNIDNVGRSLTNTEFAVLVAEGWVGSHSGQSSYLAEIIKETLSAGRAAIYAVKEKR